MRIAIFSDIFYPELSGIYDSLATIAPALAARGHEIHFYVPRYGRTQYAMANKPFGKEIDLGPRVHIHRLFSLPFPTPASRQARAIIPTGLRWLAMRKERPDVIHSNVFFGAGIEALVASRLLDTPLVATNHTMIDQFVRTLPLQKITASFLLRYETWYHNRCDFVSGPSASILKSMVARGLTRPHETISNPIDTAGFAPVPTEKKRELKKLFSFGSPAIVSAGRLAPEKEIDVIIRAFAIYVKKFPHATLGIAGDGSMRKSLEYLATREGIFSHVRFVGALSHHMLSQFYNAGDVFAIASISETQSLVLMQAFACHLPAIGVDAGALSEYILPDNGFTVQPGDSKSFAAALATITPLAHDWKRLHPHAFMATRQNTPDHIARKWESVYNNVIRTHHIHQP